MPYDMTPSDDGCYEGTTCLINKFGVRDERILASLEADITFAKAARLEASPIAGDFDAAHYKSIHKYLFEDIYDWAGEFRRTDISKKGTRFCDFEKLEKNCAILFFGLKKRDHLKGLPKTEFVDELVELYVSLNYLHPFREGNGRTQRAFLSQLVKNAGYVLNFSGIDADLLMIATIQSAQGVTNGLRLIFAQNVETAPTDKG